MSDGDPVSGSGSVTGTMIVVVATGMIAAERYRKITMMRRTTTLSMMIRGTKSVNLGNAGARTTTGIASSGLFSTFSSISLRLPMTAHIV
jgi:hypothetical protein